jgi:DNA-directed RNA polymerase subunit RPC12/RpoP
MNELCCFTCGKHIGYTYSSQPVHPINCVECGLEELEAQEQDDEEACPECFCRGCNGECF